MTELLVSRTVAGLFPTREESNGESYVSVDTAREFRVMGERGHESGVFLDDDGIMHHADWMPGREPSEGWWTNSIHAVEVSLALDAKSIVLAIGPITWRNPLSPGELAPGYELAHERATLTVSWDDGRSWAKAVGSEFAGSALSAIATWLPYTVDEIVESIDNPPGPVGLVPYRRFEQITVEEALRKS